MLSDGNNRGKSSGSTLDMPISANPAITLAIPVGCEVLGEERSRRGDTKPA